MLYPWPWRGQGAPNTHAVCRVVGLLERYQHVYVWHREFESGGRLWKQVCVAVHGMSWDGEGSAPTVDCRGADFALTLQKRHCTGPLLQPSTTPILLLMQVAMQTVVSLYISQCTLLALLAVKRFR